MVEENGFVVTHELLGDGTSREIAPSAWSNSSSRLWFHLDLSDMGVKNWLRQSSGLSEIALHAIMTEDTRPRIAPIENGLLICLRGVNFNPGATPDDMVALRLWISENRILSLRRRKVEAINDLKKSLAESRGPSSSSEFLVELCRLMTDRISEVVNEIEDGIDDIEEEMLEKERFSIRSKLSEFRKMIIQMRRYLAPQRDMLTRLQNEQADWLIDSDRLYLRESADRTIRCIEDLDAIRERAAVMQEELNVRLSEQMNQNFYMMSIVATVFLPLGLLTGLLGTNVGGIPGTGNPWAFLVVCGILLFIAIAEYCYFKKKQML